MKRLLSPLLIAILAAGCTSRDEEAQARLDAQDKQITALQQSITDLAKAVHAPRPPTEADVAREQKVADLEARLATASARIAALEQAAAKPAPTTNALAAAPAATAPAPSRAVMKYQNKPPLISVYSSPDARAADFIVSPAGTNPDLFPVAVRSVTGRRIATGTHPTTKLVETDEVYKDDFGRDRKRTKEVTEQVPEYAYEVTFNLENLTRTEKVVSCTAGAATRMLTLSPGEKRSDIVVRSEVGASLRIEIGQDFKRYAVSYE